MQISLIILEPQKTEFGRDLWSLSSLIYYNCRQLDQASQGCAHLRFENLQRLRPWNFSVKTVLVHHPSHFDFFTFISSWRFCFGFFNGFLCFILFPFLFVCLFLVIFCLFVGVICFRVLLPIQQDERSCVFMNQIWSIN